MDFIKIVRNIPGFGCYNFYDHIVELRSRGHKQQIKLMIQIGPYCARFINPSNSILEERISYSSIISMEIMANMLQINFSLIGGGILGSFCAIIAGKILHTNKE